MTNVTYTLSNGTVVNTYAEAKASGLNYKVTYTPVPKEPIRLTEKERAIRVKAEV